MSDWKSISVTVSAPESEAELLKSLEAKYAKAEEAMLQTFNEALFGGSMGGDGKWVPPTRWERIREVPLRIYYFFRSRVTGIWNVLRYGECKRCENDNYYD